MPPEPDRAGAETANGAAVTGSYPPGLANQGMRRQWLSPAQAPADEWKSGYEPRFGGCHDATVMPGTRSNRIMRMAVSRPR